MLRCKEVVELVASDAWRDPPFSRRFAVLLHLALCRYCRAYALQLARIRATARRFYAGIALDATAGARILTAVREATGRPQHPESPNIP
jgi:hypothetical protein